MKTVISNNSVHPSNILTKFEILTKYFNLLQAKTLKVIIIQSLRKLLQYLYTI